jgi:hypothetical protein
MPMYKAILAALLMTVASPVLAKTCVIVVPTDQLAGNYSPSVVRQHEIAHCNGWDHKHDEVFPPEEYVYKPRMRVEEMSVPTRVAKAICKGHIGCQWFE